MKTITTIPLFWGYAWRRALFIPVMAREIATDLWFVAKAIHSSERVTCGIGGTIGGAIGLIPYLYLSQIQDRITPSQGLMLVVFGFLVGGVVGVVDYKMFSWFFNGSTEESA